MKMRLALLQSELVRGNVAENLSRFDGKVAACRGIDAVLLPEMFASGSMMVKKSPEVAVAEQRNVASRYEDIRRKMSEWARACGAVVAGSTVCEESGRCYNRLIVAFPDGRQAYYDKRHCFRMGGEHEHFSSGDRRLTVEYRGVKVAVFVCYDLRFPVWCRNTEEYDIAVFVANWPESRREAWKTLLKARAIENQAFVAGVNCVGKDDDGVVYAGDSMVVDAYGRILGAAGEFREEMLVVDCDMASLQAFRRKFPVLEDRDVFQIR